MEAKVIPAFLTRETILAASDIRTEPCDVPEWGGAVLVRGLTGAQRDEFEATLVEYRGRKRILHLQDVRARLVALSVVNSEGVQIFTDSDVRALTQKSAVALQRVFAVAQRLSGLSDEDVEELTKNSDGGPSGSSTSG